MVNLIIPVWKAKETLPKTLDSVVAQTKKMFLVTLVQDCDGEDYSDIVEEYQRRGLHLSLIQRETNGGPGAARQTGLDANKMCDYVMFLDADDMLHPQAIEILQREIQLNCADVIMSDMAAEMPHAPNYYLPAKTTPVQWCGGKIYRAQYLREKNIHFRDDLRLNEDAYFNLVAYNATEKHYKIAQETYIWRYNDSSLTRTEGTEEFFKKSWFQYLQSQVYGLQKLYELSAVKDSLLGATILNIYSHEMKAVHIGAALTKEYESLSSLYEILANIEPLTLQLDNQQFWQYVYTNLKEWDMDNDEIYFFKERFINWMNKIWRFL